MVERTTSGPSPMNRKSAGGTLPLNDLRDLAAPGCPPRGGVVVVGPGARFLSGISYHTAALVRAFYRQGGPVSALLIRQLCPAWAYPGRARIGAYPLNVLDLDGIECHEGLDWSMIKSLRPALSHLQARRPEVVVLQWWTAATAHNYLVLARAAQRMGAKVVIEMHEASDVGEAALPLVFRYSKSMMARLRPYLSGVVVHSKGDAQAMSEAHPVLHDLPTAVVLPGPNEHHQPSRAAPPRARGEGDQVRFLYFGVIRPYKGVDELASAFEALSADSNVHLTLAGEPWEGAGNVIARIRALGEDRATVIDRFLADEEIPLLLQGADVVVLPYRRASVSGPVNVAMAAGLPLVTTTVPALQETCENYAGVEFADPRNPASLEAAMRRAMRRVGYRYANPHSWDASAVLYQEFFERIPVAQGSRVAVR